VKISKIAFSYAVLNNGWRIVSGPVLLLMIPAYLTKLDQGYWYLFFSLSAIFSVADMGISQLIIQYTAQATRTVKLISGCIKGEDDDLNLLSHIFVKTERHIKIYGNFVFVMVSLIGIAFLLYNRNFNFYHVSSWAIYVSAAYLNFKNYYYSSYVEGLHFLMKSQKMKLVCSLTSTSITVSLLILGFGLYALSIGMIISSFMLSFYYEINFIQQIRKFSAEHARSVSFELPIFNSLTKKYMISFISGYFIFNGFVPISNVLVSPEFSGKVGLSLALAIAIFSLANSSLQVAIPRINNYIASKQTELARAMFVKSISIGTIFYSTLSLAFFAVIINATHPAIDKLESRVLPLGALASVLTCYGLQFLVNSYATFVRAYNVEPFVAGSAMLAIWVPATSVVTAYFGYEEYIFLGWLVSFSVWLPFAIYQYRQKILT
jgi:hypothetical protein